MTIFSENGHFLTFFHTKTEYFEEILGFSIHLHPKTRLFHTKIAFFDQKMPKSMQIWAFFQEKLDRNRGFLQVFPIFTPKNPTFSKNSYVFVVFVLFASKIDAFFFHFHRLAKMP